MSRTVLLGGPHVASSACITPRVGRRFQTVKRRLFARSCNEDSPSPFRHSMKPGFVQQKRHHVASLALKASEARNLARNGGKPSDKQLRGTRLCTVPGTGDLRVPDCLSIANQRKGRSLQIAKVTGLITRLQDHPNCCELSDPPSSEWGVSLFTVSFFGVSLLSVALMICARDATLVTLGVMLLLAVISFAIAYGPLEEDARKGELQPRQPGLPPDWHNLYHPTKELTFYYNSETKVCQWEAPELLVTLAAPDVSQTSDDLVASYLAHGIGKLSSVLLKLPVTVALYLAPLYETLWLLRHAGRLGVWTSGVSVAAAAALPQPLPALVLALGPFAFGMDSSFVDIFQATVTVAFVWESVLCLALLVSIGYGIHSLMATLKRAARARLPPCEPTGDSSLLTGLLCALCPGFGWRLHPFAFGLNFRRIVILPLPSKVPLPIPVPRWELLPGTLVAFLYATPVLLPLVRCLAAATESSRALGPSTLLKILLSSPVFFVGVSAAVATVLVRKQKEAYETALAAVEGASNGAELQEKMHSESEGPANRTGDLEDAFENLLKEEFDARLGVGDL